ncbi:ATP-binding cassette domain-containing protein, partial [Shewanella sp. 0m-11]
SHRLTHFPNQLSGGEQQRVAIARAFICEPKVLFADEPTGNLDSANSDKIADMLFELNRESDTTLVLVTHDMQLASRCERQLIMDSGHLSEKGVQQPTKQDVSHTEAGTDDAEEASAWS